MRTHRHLLLPLTLLTTLGACSNAVSGDDDPQSRAATLEAVALSSAPHWAGDTARLELRVLGREGQPLSGVAVSLRVLSGGGSPVPARVVSDSAGMARARWVLGNEGVNSLEAVVSGTTLRQGYGVMVETRPRVSFTADELVLNGIGCSGELFAQVLRGDALVAGDGVQFTAAPAELVSFSTVMTTGTTRGMRRVVRGLQAGVAQVVATHHSGAADTARVQVQPNTPTDLATIGVPVLGAGFSATVSAWVRNGCGVRMSGEPISFRTLHPQVATVDVNGVVTGRGGGRGQIVAESGTLADTVPVYSLSVSILPADTTIYVGEVVQYRVSGSDGTSTITTPVAMRSGQPEVADLPSGSSQARAVAPGMATIVAYVAGAEGRTTLRVIPRP